MHASALGADGKIYFGGFGLRHYTGGGFGWYDPDTKKMNGFWKPLSGYAVQWITHVVGKIDPVGSPTFVGRDLYLSGPEQLRRIRNITPAP